MARMRDIKAAAKKRRAEYLKEFEKLPEGTTITEYAEMYHPEMTRARISKIINKAREEKEAA